MFRGIATGLAAGVLLVLSAARGQDDEVKIGTVLSMKPYMMEIARMIKQEKGLDISLSTEESSVDAVNDLGEGTVRIAIITKPLTLEDRSAFPGTAFDAIPVGMQVVAMGVADDVWEAGVRTISKETMHDIYEHTITNWKQIPHGPDENISFYSVQQGEGVWEMFAEWLYGDNRKAPLPLKREQLGTNEDVRDTLEFTPGSIGPVPAAMADGSHCHPLGIDLGERVANPSTQDVAGQYYPVVRPIFAVVAARQPDLDLRVVTEYLTGPRGQALLKKGGDLGVDAVPKALTEPGD
ncbi:MAG: substrate-binding domain-containing protein [Chthoniobacteraceae bacterium]|jgi:ABC-type phosphate transport system substrate-binding protein